MDKLFAGFLMVVTALGLLIWLPMWGLPKYAVYQQELTGKAELARADQSRQILITQAKAEMEAAKLRATAINIVGEASARYPEYRQQEFIGAFADALRAGNITQIIYVPTESNIPVMEAGKR